MKKPKTSKNDTAEKRTVPLPLLDLGTGEAPEELNRTLTGWGEKPYRARQVLRQIYQRGVLDFRRMTDLSAALRERLARAYDIQPLTSGPPAVSKDGTRKTLWRLEDDSAVESVVIPMERGHSTVCLSTQTGCALKCAFCATGRLGAGRNLTPGEILYQALAPLEELSGGPVRDSVGTDKSRSPNYVIMGMGEPFLNYDNLAVALRVMNHNDFMQVGARRITVSTVGLPEGMLRFSRDFPQMKLAVSLHAATEELRRRLMPVARRVPLAALLKTCREVFGITGRRITFEYLVLGGVNDRAEDVEALAGLTRGLPCKINLIGFNRVPGIEFNSSDQRQLENFRDRLLASCKQAVTLRQSHGADIAGGCGQLAAGRST